MKTTGVFMHKEDQVDITDCVIEKIIILSDEEYTHFNQDLFANRDFIHDNIDLMGIDKNDIRHCLLILSETREVGCLIDSQGYSYARYVSYQPQAKLLVDNQVKQLANYVVSEGIEHTEDGTWGNSYEEFQYHFGVIVTPDNGIGKLLQEELQRREEVSECILDEDGIKITYYIDFCPECQQSNISDTLNGIGYC